MKHAILLLWHKDSDQLKELISRFNANFSFYIHLDKKSAVGKEEMQRLKQCKGVAGVYKKFKTNWGGFHILKAELFLLKIILKDPSVEYIHSMSAQDYPIKNLRQIETFFEQNAGKEFISVMKLPDDRWENGSYVRFRYYRPYDCFDFRKKKGQRLIRKIVDLQAKYGIRRRIPDQYEQLYGGSAWFSITRSCAAYIMQHSKRSFYRRLNYTFAPEETFFPTVVMNSPFAGKVINDNLRFIVWKRQNKSFPAILDHTNWADIATSGALFARKFDPVISSRLKSYLDAYILTEEQVEVNDRGYWLNNTLAGHCFDPGLGKAILSVLSYTEARDIADFGCGPGWYVALLRKEGYEAQGYDGNPNVEHLSSLFFPNGFYCQQADLSEELTTDTPFDMIICLEVGEHIPVAYEETFFKNLAKNAGSYILLSWAIGNQEGDGHVNCRPNRYVIDQLAKLGFSLNIPVSNYLRSEASLPWFHKTIMFFQKILLPKAL